MRLRPLNDTILVKIEEDEWNIKKPEGIILSDEAIAHHRKRSCWGRVLSWGDKCFYKHKIGERVHFKWVDYRPSIETEDGFVRCVYECELDLVDEDA